MPLRPHESTQDSGRVVIEDGTTGDLPAIMAVMAAAFDARYGEAWNIDQCRSMLSLPGTSLLVARSQEVLLGFAFTRAILSEQELLMIAVDPRARGRQIAAGMLARLERDGAARGITSIFLEVRKNNSARTLYERLGFEQIGIRRDYYTGTGGKKYDAVTYRLKLD